MAPLVKFLYRMLRSNCKAIFLPHNREFLQSSLDSCHESLMLLSRGFPIIKNFANDPEFELDRAFREGSEEDVQVLFSILPGLLRYSRAAKIIEQHIQETLPAKGNNRKNIWLFDDPNMLSGAMLISKLYYNEKELTRRSLDTLVKEGVEELTTALKLELEKQLLVRRKLEKAVGKSSYPKSTLVEKRRSQILALLNALHTVILRQEARRSKDLAGRREHLVDQVLLPEGAYCHALPITYSVLYSAVINSIAHLDLQAVGIAFPQWFLTRIVVRNSRQAISSGSKLNTEDFLKGGPAQFSRRRDLQNVPREVSFMDLLGNWVGFYTKGMKEVRLVYDKATRVLEAVRIDDGLLAAGQVAWSMDLSSVCRKSSFLAMNTPYPVNVRVAPASNKDTESVPYTLTLVVLPASIFQPTSLNMADTGTEAPYFEIQLTPVEAESQELSERAVSSETDSNSTALAMRSVAGGPHSVHTFAPTTIARTHNNSSSHPSLHTHSEHSHSTSTNRSNTAHTGPAEALRSSPRPRSTILRTAAGRTSTVKIDSEGQSLESLVFCRTVDLDRCLLDISDQGVIPLTPTTYLKLLSVNGKGADRLPDILRPASSSVVTCRMAANLANSATGSLVERLFAEEDLARDEDAAFWTAVRRLFDEKIKRSEI